MDEPTTEAVAIIAAFLEAGGSPSLTWEQEAAQLLDALTKPRTEPCTECGGTGDKILYDQSGYGNPPDRESCDACGGSGKARCPTCGGTGHDDHRDPDGVPNPNFCKACSGSGTVTRGPIAVLVPPDAVEIMARVVALRARGGGNPWSRDRVLAEAILDALYRRTGAG